jgi:hypothetical protein
MRFSLIQRLRAVGLLVGILSLAATPASAQIFRRGGSDCPPPPCYPAPAPQAITTPAPETGTTPSTPSTTVPTTPMPSPSTSNVDLSAVSPESSLALSSATTARSDVGYIDSAIPMTVFRLRVDSAVDDNRPDRAEFFYAKCGCFRVAGIDPNAKGPGTGPEFKVDFVDVNSYFEVAVNERFSAFIELPVRWVELNDNHDTNGGFADMNVGFKAALIADPCQYLTFQFRAYIPTGDSFQGLGTDHVSLEPALLAYQKLSDKCRVEAEFRDWIPIGGSDFAGNVIRYGAGISYDIYRGHGFTIAPVEELVGWTVLGGKELTPDGVKDAAGDTIVNFKTGVRTTFGEHSDLYFGYGRALTGDVWYKQIFRLEYRLIF